MEITALSGTVAFWGADCNQMRQMSQTKMKQHIIVIYKTETEKVRKHVSKRHFPGGKEQGHKQMETGSHSPKAGNCVGRRRTRSEGDGGVRGLAPVSGVTAGRLAAGVLTAAGKGEN